MNVSDSLANVSVSGAQVSVLVSVSTKKVLGPSLVVSTPRVEQNKLWVRFLAVSDIYPIFIEPTITWVPSGFSGYIWLDTKIVLKNSCTNAKYACRRYAIDQN